MNYEDKKNKALRHAEHVKQKQELHELKHSNDKPKEKLSFSKIAFIFMITNCVVIEIYALVAMFCFSDLSSLSALIAAVVGECVSMAAYFIKSDHENTKGGIVYESAMAKLKYELENDDSVG
jgi:cytosine/uracil/thiamine/allantoin permease